MIGQASEQSGPVVEWLVADAESLPFPSDSFDVVFSNLMVQWCDDPRTVFAECRRVLRPGGRLVLSTLLEGTLTELKQAWLWLIRASRTSIGLSLNLICGNGLRLFYRMPVWTPGP